MPLKAVILLLAAIISGWGDISIAKNLNTNSQVVMRG